MHCGCNSRRYCAIRKKTNEPKKDLGNTAVVVSKTSSSKLQASEVANDLVIQIGILPADAISDETKKVIKNLLDTKS